MKLFARIALGVSLFALAATSAAAQDKTFRIWWFASADSAQGIGFAKALEEFKASHPDVTVQFELKTFEQIVKSGNMILNSDQAPDLTEYNKGNGVAGLAASQGLLSNLEDVAKQRGWNRVLNDANTQLGRYDSNGIYGSGPLVGIPSYGEFVSIFYNKKMFDQYQLKVPTTLEELESVMGVFASKGITPMTTSGNGYGVQQLTYSIALSKASPEWVANFQGQKAPLDVAPLVYAGRKIQEWVSKGYLSKDDIAIKPDDMALQFSSGKSPMVLTGTWFSTRFSKLDFPTGKFLFPGATIVPASTGNILIVPKNARNKELAYEFIDLVLGQEIQTVMANNGGIPLAADPANITDPLGKQDVAIFDEIVKRNGLGFYPDWPVSGFYEAMLKANQALMAGTVTPEEFAERLRKVYDDAQAEH